MFPAVFRQALAGRYALALFELARDARQIEAVGASLATLRGAIDESEDLRTLITSPLIAREEQARRSARWSAACRSTSSPAISWACSRRIAGCPQLPT
jgi:hypothetical protein